MGWIDDEEEPTLYADKTATPNFRLPVGATDDNVPKAADFNAIKQALIDTRNYVRAIDVGGGGEEAVATHAALTATHGVAGALVGTTDTQTLQNKTFTGAETLFENAVRVDGFMFASGDMDVGGDFDVSGLTTATGGLWVDTSFELDSIPLTGATDGSFSGTIRAAIYRGLAGLGAFFKSDVADSGTAVAHDFDTENDLANVAAKLFRLRRAGTEVLHVLRTGALRILGVASGENAITIPDQTYINFGTASGWIRRRGGEGLNCGASFRAAGDFITETGIYRTAGNVSSVFRGSANAASDTIVNKFAASVDQTVDGARLAVFYSDTEVTERFSISRHGSPRLPAFTVATVPSAATPATGAGSLIYVSDGAAGSPCLAVSDGTDWLRCDTLTAVSAS